MDMTRITPSRLSFGFHPNERPTNCALCAQVNILWPQIFFFLICHVKGFVKNSRFNRTT